MFSFVQLNMKAIDDLTSEKLKISTWFANSALMIRPSKSALNILGLHDSTTMSFQ